MTEKEIKELAIKLAEEKNFKITKENRGFYKLETETEIIEIGTTTHAKATVCIDRFTKEGKYSRIPTGHQLVNIGCKETTALRKITKVI